jgi:hypothetical protein
MSIEELEQAIRELIIEVARQGDRIRELAERVPDPYWAEKAEAESLRADRR